MKQDMTKVLDLVRSGKLSEATSAIQSRLGGGGGDQGDGGAPAEDAAPEGGMRDVTPRAKAIGSGATRSEPRAKAKPQAKRPARPREAKRWERVAGPIPYRISHPAEATADAPLIVMLHGCTQTPEDFAAGTGMADAAGRIGAHVVWPEQGRAANANGCWNWFETAHQGRSGEAEGIAAIAEAVRGRLAPSARGIHVAGLSAGGAMAAILGARYPEIFASVGVHSGLAAGAAGDMPSAFAAMRSGGRAGAPLGVPAIVFHGTADRTVAPANGAAVARSAQEGAKPRRGTVTRGGRRSTVTRVASPEGAPLLERWEVEGLGHAWSGGNAAGSHTDPAGPDATAEMLRFFLSVR